MGYQAIPASRRDEARLGEVGAACPKRAFARRRGYERGEPADRILGVRRESRAPMKGD